MEALGPQWRDRSYEITLDTVLATATEFSRYRDHAPQVPPAALSGSLNVSYSARTPSAGTAMPPAELDASSLSPCTLQNSPPSSDDTLYCPERSCNASFIGASRFSNCSRHVKTALHHNQDAGPKCPVCYTAFSRPDNLKQHLRNIHHLDPPVRSQRKISHPNGRGIGG